MDKLLDFLTRNQTFVLADGAMGTMLHAAGLTSGGAPEEWNAARPDVIKGIHQAYVDAGSQIITTNTFGGNRYRLALHNNQDRVPRAQRCRRAHRTRSRRCRAARGARRGRRWPVWRDPFPAGTTQPEDVRAAFAEQAAALAEGGVDFFLIETMSALEEVTAAVEGIKSATDLPIAVTMTFDTHFRTMMGVKPAAGRRGSLRPWYRRDGRQLRQRPRRDRAHRHRPRRGQTRRMSTSLPRATPACPSSRTSRSTTTARPKSWPPTR